MLFTQRKLYFTDKMVEIKSVELNLKHFNDCYNTIYFDNSGITNMNNTSTEVEFSDNDS